MGDFEGTGLIELERELAYHAAMPDERAAVFSAATWQGARGRTHVRQRRMPRVAKLAAGKALRRAHFEDARTFEGLLQRVQAAIGGVHGVGGITVYDAALRIGASRGLSPSRVRLHGTSRESALLLGLAVERKRWIEGAAFPAPLSGLRPSAIERFLSSYRDALEDLAEPRYGASLTLASVPYLLGRSHASPAGRCAA